MKLPSSEKTKKIKNPTQLEKIERSYKKVLKLLEMIQKDFVSMS